MKNWLKRLLVIDLILMAGHVAAQSAGGSGMANLSAIQAGGQVPGDLATQIMQGLLGPMYSSPFTSGLGATSLFGVLFLAFNMVVFSAGVIWASYGVGVGIVQTAHEGVVLGRRLNAVWFPIRMATGIGSLTPVFGGFSLSQIVMIVATSWGITFGNYAYLQALNAMANFTPLLSVQVAKGPGIKSASDLANAIFEQRLCEIDYQAKQTDMQSNGLNVPSNDQLRQTTFSTLANIKSGVGVGTAMGTNNDPLACKAVGIAKKEFAARSSSSAFGFRVNTVNYQAIADGAYNRYASNWPNFYRQVRQLADQWVNDSKTANDRVPVPEDKLTSQAVAFASGVSQAAMPAAVNASAITQAATAQMRQNGFLSAGSFYSTYGEVNASITQAADSVEYVIVDSGAQSSAAASAGSGEYTKWQRAYAERRTSSSANAAQQQENSWCKAIETATGNCSLGQTILEKALAGLTSGSGGGGSGTFQIIDPIIAAKNIGDYMMTTGEGILAFSAITGSVGKVAEKASGLLGSVPGVGWVASAVSGGLSSIASMLPIMGGMLLAVGALLALYIPMVPFINWVSAIVQYFSIVVQSFAAAPLWAFAHLQAEGEGMGQRTERGYLYLLLLLFKPILMVVGFFAACGLVILIGSAVLYLFLPAIASAQGNSITGLGSIIGYAIMFFMIMNIIIQGMFNLVEELSDDTIGWVGNVGKSTIGRGMEDKAHNVFMMGGRFGSSAAERAVGAGMGRKAAAAAAGTGKGTPQPPKSRPGVM